MTANRMPQGSSLNVHGQVYRVLLAYQLAVLFSVHYLLYVVVGE